MADRQGGDYRRDFVRWLVWAVLAPTAVMVASYAFAVVSKLPSAFNLTFGTMETLPVAALFLIAVKQDIDKLEPQHAGGWTAILNGEAIQFVCFLIWLSYGAIKNYALAISVKGTPDVETQLTGFGVVSILVLLIAGMYAALVRFKVLSLQLESKITQAQA